MTVVRRVKPGDLERQLRRDLERLVGRVDKAIAETAKGGAEIVRENAPEAFGELRDGIEATATSIRSTAPHAAAVEVGSRPHMPPFAPILAWVRPLRRAGGRHVEAPCATEVAGRIRERGDGASTPVDAAERVAWAVCHKIAREGTKPTWYVRDSLPDVFTLLDENMRNAVFRED